MLSDWVLDILRCPETMARFESHPDGLRRASDGKLYPDRDGIASLVYPAMLDGDDAHMNRRYEWLAPFYDVSERVLGRLLTGVDMEAGREKIVSLLGLEPGMRLLEVSPGPGVFQPMLRARLGEAAEIASVDLSLNMLRQCRKHHAAQHIELIQANAQHLPFADATFDALFHFGGVNLFNDPGQAVDEFLRVVRKGGLVTWGDEMMSENFRHPVGRWLLPRINPGFKKTPPSVPDSVMAVRRYEVYDGLGYLIVGVKA